MAALISKPGIGGATQLSIPKDWSATWFRSLVADLLKGADVRNAIAGPGIKITGNISSPYATISAGGSGPVTFQGTVTITTPATAGPTLIVQPGNGVGNQAAVFHGTSTNNDGYILFVNDTSSTVVGAIGAGVLITGAGVNDLQFYSPTAIDFSINSGTSTDMRIAGTSASPTLQFRGATAGALVDMTPDTQTFTGTLTGYATPPTGNVIARRMGNFAILYVASITGTSNANTLTMTGLPAAWQPANRQMFPCSLIDNGMNVLGLADIPALAGTITFYRSSLVAAAIGSAVQFVATAFTTTGTKALNLTVIGPYELA